MANIKLTLPAEPFTTQIVTFTAPCDCASVSDGLSINGETYTVCDAMGNCVTGKGGAWCAGAQISVVLDCENKKAFIQNAAVPEMTIDNVTGLQTALDAKVSKSGDTMTGDLTFRKVNNGFGKVMKSHTDSEDYGTLVMDVDANNNYVRLQLRGHDQQAFLGFSTGGTQAQNYPVLHTGNLADMGVAKIATGTYTGTGTYGEQFPCHLAFEFDPKIVFISDGSNWLMVFVGLATNTYAYQCSFAIHNQSVMSGGPLVKYSNKTLSYCTENVGSDTSMKQFNTAGNEYIWVAIG